MTVYVFRRMFHRMVMFYEPSILFFCCDMLQNNSEETMEPRLDQSQMWLLRCWLCLSCLQMQLKADSSFSGFFFSLPRIYIHKLSLWHKLQTKSIQFIRKCHSGPRYMASVQQKGCLCEPAHISCLLRRKSAPEISEWQLKSGDETISHNVIYSQEDTETQIPEFRVISPIKSQKGDKLINSSWTFYVCS